MTTTFVLDEVDQMDIARSSVACRSSEQAIENIKEAIALYLESLKAHNDAVPPPITEELVEVEA